MAEKTAAERVALARHPQRPNAQEIFDGLFTDLFIQRGDRLAGEVLRAMDPFIILAREDGNAFLIVVDRGEIHLICAVLRHITGCNGDISLIVCDGLYDLVKRHALVLGLRSHFFGDCIRLPVRGHSSDPEDGRLRKAYI